MSIRQLLLQDALSTPETELLDAKVRRRFGPRLDALPTPMAAVLAPFVTDAPWRYVSDEVFDGALDALGEDPGRTIEAVRVHRLALDRGLAALFRSRNLPEGNFSQLSANELVTIADQFLPNYLQAAEHIFGNTLRVYWSVVKKGKVTGQFDLKGAVATLEQRGRASLLAGFDDRVRNAIAHGETAFHADAIAFGAGSHARRLTSSDFLRLHDDLVRTCNGLGAALIIFWAQHTRLIPASIAAPPSMAARVAGAHLNRPGIRVLGAIESNLALVGLQLNVALQLAEREHTIVLGRCLQLAAHLLEAGAEGYDRFAIEVSQGEPVSSLILVDPAVLRALLDEDADISELPRALVETPILWWNESKLRSRIRLWSAAVGTSLRQAREAVVSRWHELGVSVATRRYRIREVENLSVSGVARVRIYAAMEEPQLAQDPEVVLAIVKRLIRYGRRRWFFPYSRLDGRRVGLPKRPEIVMIDLFRSDGPLRWLRGGGWLAGNIVTVAERTWRGREHVHVTNPQAEVDGVRFRFEIDAEAAGEALKDMADLVKRLRRERGLE